MSSTNETPSSSNWTPANRGKAFDAAASAAFGTKRAQQKPDAGRAEFSGLAASAFNNKRNTEKSEPVKEAPVTQSRFASALAALPVLPAPDVSAPMSHAFGKKRATESSRFDETASAAFGKKQTTQESNEPSMFDGAAASAFGKKRHDDGDNLFGDQAASVFGKKRKDRRDNETSSRPTIVIQKQNTLWAAISELMPEAPKEPERQWTGSAIRQQKKKAEDEAAAAIAAKKKSATIEVTESEFPTLGFAPKPVSNPISKSSSGNSFSALADDFPTLGSKPVSKSSSSTSFAEIMRKRIEQEEAEAKAEAERRAKEEATRQRAYMERVSNPIITLRRNVGTTGNYYDEDDFNPDYNDENDLDYVHPSEMSKRGPASSYYDNDEDEYGPIDDEEDDNSAW